MNPSTKIGGEILEAVASGDLAKLKGIKERVGDVDFRKICNVIGEFSTGRRVLHRAAEMGHLEICKFLIEKARVHIDVLTDREHSPLMLAANAERIDVVKYLIKKGAQVDMSSDKGFTALHYAVEKDNFELMKLLLDEGASIDEESVDGTPLRYAASRGSVEAVKFLLDRNAKTNAISLIYGSPLVSAIKSRSFECMELLLEANANPNQILFGLNSLAQAAKESDTRYLKRLIEAGACPKLLADAGFLQPIEHAVMANNLEGVKILFPLTERISSYINWSVDSIMTYYHSDETRLEREISRIAFSELIDQEGKSAVKRKDYVAAIKCYTEAILVEPSNPRWLANRSLCFTRIPNRVAALRDAQECVRLSPKWAKAHYREGSAWMLFKNYGMAGNAFAEAYKLNPHDQDILKAFKVAQAKFMAPLAVLFPQEAVDLLKRLFPQEAVDRLKQYL